MYGIQRPTKTTKASLIEWAEEQMSRGIPRQVVCDYLFSEDIQKLARGHPGVMEALAETGRALSGVMLDRNLRGQELEKAEAIDEAIALYEANVADACGGNHPYDRLAILYRKRGQIDQEIRVLERAIWVFENIASKGRADRLPKLKKFKERLAKAKGLREKAGSSPDSVLPR